MHPHITYFALVWDTKYCVRLPTLQVDVHHLNKIPMSSEKIANNWSKIMFFLLLLIAPALPYFIQTILHKCLSPTSTNYQF